MLQLSPAAACAWQCQLRPIYWIHLRTLSKCCFAGVKTLDLGDLQATSAPPGASSSLFLPCTTLSPRRAVTGEQSTLQQGALGVNLSFEPPPAPASRLHKPSSALTAAGEALYALSVALLTQDFWLYNYTADRQATMRTVSELRQNTFSSGARGRNSVPTELVTCWHMQKEEVPATELDGVCAGPAQKAASMTAALAGLDAAQATVVATSTDSPTAASVATAAAAVEAARIEVRQNTRQVVSESVHADMSLEAHFNPVPSTACPLQGDKKPSVAPADSPKAPAQGGLPGKCRCVQ